MTDRTDHERLLGRVAYEPTPRLRAGARHADGDAYRRFVAGSATDDYWLAVARELPWNEAPVSARRDATWFPDGRFNLGAALLERCAPEPLVDWDGGETLHRVTRDELERRAGGLVARFAAVGLEPGQRVGLALPRGPSFVTALIACWHQGLVAVPADLGRDGETVVRRVRETGCRLILTGPGATVGIESRPVAMLRFDPVPLVVWDGTAGRAGALPAALPRPAQHPALLLADAAGPSYTIGAAGLAVSGLSALRHLADGRGAGDTVLLLNPFHHSSFLGLTTGALLAGQTIALATAPDPTLEGMVAAAAATGSRVAVAEGAALARLAGSAMDAGERRGLSGPALLVVEGESVEPRLVHWLRDGLLDGTTHVVQALSRPETGGFVAGPGASSLPVRPGSVSLPAPGFALTVVDPKGRLCLVGQGGLLALERPAPSLAAELSSGAAPFVLGVRARADRDGNLWVMGEVTIPRAHEDQVSLPELEAVIAAVDGVEHAAAIRFEDAQGVTRTRAFVASPAGEAILERLRAAVVAHLGERALPDSFQLVARLPYSRSGKLLRSVLRRVSTGEIDGLEDVAAVADPEIVRELIDGSGRPKST